MSGEFGFTILGSGSKGNATVIHSPHGKILLDSGFSTKELCTRLNGAGVAPDSIQAILITHAHSDHTSACRIFADKYDIPVYLTSATCKELSIKNNLPAKKYLIVAGTPFEICGIRMDPFSVPHDVDAVAYTFTYNSKKLGFATDLGFLSMLAMQKLKGCDSLVIEANHDVKMLHNSSRPLHLKRRILGRQGHLSNETTLNSLDELLTEMTRRLVFAHVSNECNCVRLLSELAQQKLESLRRNDVLFGIATQSAPMETAWI